MGSQDPFGGLMAISQGLYYPFKIIKGETFGFSFELIVKGEQKFFDEYDFVGQVRNTESIQILIANMTFTESEESSSIIDVEIPSTDTAMLNVGEYSYEINATDKETGVVRVIFRGTFGVEDNLIFNPPQPFIIG